MNDERLLWPLVGATSLKSASPDSLQAGWAGLQQAGEVLEPGEQLGINITLDMSLLSAGANTALLVLSTNDKAAVQVHSGKTSAKAACNSVANRFGT